MNQTDTTSGYVLDSQTINNTPLATGSFTQLAILSPGLNADFANGSGTNAGFGNQAIWANGQRDTSNSIAVNGVTADNLFNGKTTSQVELFALHAEHRPDQRVRRRHTDQYFGIRFGGSGDCDPVGGDAAGGARERRHVRRFAGV